MSRLAYDKQGRLMGIDNIFVNKEIVTYSERKRDLMKSESLSFLSKGEVFDNSADSEFWSLYSNGKRLDPIRYSNNKTQEDIVKEVVTLIKGGKKVIFINGVCGTGKSAIALNIARVLGKSCIVVPLKNLQKQYEEDYTKKKYLLKSDGRKMRTAVITGRDNHDSIIFPGVSCADPFLPDTIIITDKNRDKIYEYYKENPLIKNKVNLGVRALKRISIAPSNPHWSPILPAEFELNQLSDARKKFYKGVGGRDYIFYHRKEGCSYYDQFQAYVDSEAIIFNAAKYNIEIAIGRKPETEVDIIDEADAFLDNFSKEDSLNLTRLVNSLENISPDHIEAREKLEKIKDMLLNEIKNKIALGVNENDILALKDTVIGKVLKLLANNALRAEISLDDTNYANTAVETAFDFVELFEDTYVTYSKKDNDIYANLVTTNVEKRFNELCAKTKALVLMSGTLHSKEVITNVFGIKDFSIVEAETKTPGTIDVHEGGYEINCNYSNLKSGENKRKEYLKALSSSVEKAKRPTLVHVNSFEDLPSEDEIKIYSINNIISKEKLKHMQREDKKDNRVLQFKEKITDILFTTKCSRGVDFPGDMCNSIIYTKYPNPNLQELFWKILKKTHQNYFWNIYRDRANREFLQRLYRALRSQDDYVQVLSPDSRVIDFVKGMS